MKFANFPWWLKIVIKIGLEVIPLSYERIRSLLTGYRGHMEDKSYAEKNFQNYITDYRKFSTGSKGGTLLELGPGGSLLTGVMGRIWGFKQCILIDVGDFASRDKELYDEMIQGLSVEDQKVFQDKFDETGCVIDAFREIGIIYLTRGLSSLRQISDNYVSFSFSNAVLEHVRVKEFSETISELGRIHKTGSISSHQIDYKDHLSSSLNNLRFSSKVWESRFFPNSGFYTNRLRHQDIKKAFNLANFSIERDETVFWEALPLSRSEMADEFRSYNDEQLCINSGHIVLKKLA